MKEDEDVSVKMRLQELAKVHEEDLTHLFDRRGIDRKLYDENVAFEDHLNEIEGVEGYLTSIRMLKLMFSPEYVLHSIEHDEETFSLTMR